MYSNQNQKIKFCARIFGLVGLILFTSLTSAAYSFQNKLRVLADSFYVTTSDSVKLFVKVAGSGKPVLFVHGGPGSNSAYFEYEGGNIFEKDAQMIYVDQRGCGRSDNAPNKNYSLSRIIQDFEEVRMHLKISSWTLMPGILAVQYAITHPSAIKSLILLNCTVNIRISGENLMRLVIERGNISASMKDTLLNPQIDFLERWNDAYGILHKKNLDILYVYDSKGASDIDGEIYKKFQLAHDFSRSWKEFPEYLEDYSQKTILINVPVLVISGYHDYAIGPDHYKIMRFPNAKYKFVDGGHDLYLEHQQALFEVVDPFLKRIK